jgi:hypothetical protein
MLYFHSVPSPIALIFGVRLLLQCIKSLPAFSYSYNAYFHPAPSSTALIFIIRFVLVIAMIGTCTVVGVNQTLVEAKMSHSRLNLRNLSSTVQVPNLALTHTKWTTVLIFSPCGVENGHSSLQKNEAIFGRHFCHQRSRTSWSMLCKSFDSSSSSQKRVRRRRSSIK